MRAGPLASEKTIDLLNTRFVSVYLSMEDYDRVAGTAPAEEKAELQRIFQEGRRAGSSVGMVHVYVLRPDGSFLASLHVAQATHDDNLEKLLEKTVEDMKLAPGKPLVAPACQCVSPKASKEALVLHLTARY